MAKEFRYLFFDTELSGCEQIVSIGYVITDRNGTQIDEGYFIIKPYKKIRKNTIAIHGITTEQAKAEGITLRRGMARFINATKYASVWVGFAPQNDIVALAIGCKHIGKPVLFDDGEAIIVDVARMGTPYMIEKGKINPGQTPNLSMLHDELSPDQPFAAHNALDDAKATANCFWKLMKEGWFCFDSIIPYRKVKALCSDKRPKSNEKVPSPVISSSNADEAPIVDGAASVIEIDINNAADCSPLETPDSGVAENAPGHKPKKKSKKKAPSEVKLTPNTDVNAKRHKKAKRSSKGRKKSPLSYDDSSFELPF